MSDKHGDKSDRTLLVEILERVAVLETKVELYLEKRAVLISAGISLAVAVLAEVVRKALGG